VAPAEALHLLKLLWHCLVRLGGPAAGEREESSEA
jgi:hypothetical protein